LLAKDRWRSALADKALKDWPEVSLVVGSRLLSGRGEGLTWEAGCPDGSVFRPSGELEGERPPGDACEPMTLNIARKIGWRDFSNASFIDVCFRYDSVLY
jgi:hypothetical protein